MKCKILISISIILSLFACFADSGPVIDLEQPPKELPDYLYIQKTNFEKHGYSIEVQLPQPDNPDLKRFYIKFPKTLNTIFSYSHSKALYAQGGKTLLSYRPQDASLSSSKTGEIYIVANKNVIPCISLINVYFKSDKEYGMHPPNMGVTLNLSSFLEDFQPCQGGQDANNFY